MSKIFIYNEDFLRTQRSTDPIVDIYGLSDDELFEYGWLYSTLWPTNKFEALLTKIRSVSPVIIADNPRFWDNSVSGGYAVYNHTIDGLLQTEGLEH